MTPEVTQFFAKRGWNPLPFQSEVWQAMARGESGLVHSSTGTGKTYSVWLGFLQSFVPAPGLKAIWLTPLRSLAGDTQKALREATEELGLDWRIELRTGDTSSYAKQKQVKDAPDVLITTPESLTLLLSQKASFRFFENLQLIVADEWHELIGSKRGVQTELALARLRRIAPDVRAWGLSATLGNIEEAGQILVPSGATLIRGESRKEIQIDMLLPDEVDRFPWAGHIGVKMVPPVAAEIREARSCLIFTNTRGQAEIWYQALLAQCPDLADQIALHHGSLEKELRIEVEQGLKEGRLRCVVCTSSLDLGVDFSPVDRVFQIGSPKGVARLLQRAGRSGHAPGQPSRITCVPTHALEVLDIVAARKGAELGRIEERTTPTSPFDVLSQHLVTMALAGGFREEKLRAEVLSTHSFRHLGDREWQWAMEFVTKGGTTLRAYPEFQKVSADQGVFTVPDKQIALRHRTNIGTIMSEASMQVKFLTGGNLGSVEESFVARLKKGDVFVFSGKALEFVMTKELTCFVRKATKARGVVPRWSGGRMPLSSALSHTLREIVGEIKQGEVNDPEIQQFMPLFALQAEWSALPSSGEILVEQVNTREGSHLFIFPIEGRLVHEGLCALFAYRLAQIAPRSFSVACNDYGFELLGSEEIPFDEALLHRLASTENLADDILASLNSSEMARRQFREIARIAGLVFQGYPGQKRSARQVQASSGLFYDVFSKYDPDHPLLHQARREVLEMNLEQTRLVECLARIRSSRLLLTHPPKPTPLAFPILVDRLRETIGSESIEERIQKLLEGLEKKAG